MIYLQFGFDSQKDARAELEEIASAYCRKEGYNSFGEIEKIDNKKVRTIKEYDISFKNNKVNFEEKIST